MKRKTIEEYLTKAGISSLVEVLSHADYKEGMKHLIISYGLGSLQPNTIAIPITAGDRIDDAVEVIATARQQQKNVILFKDGSDISFKEFNEPAYFRKKIALWRDNDYTGNFDFMLSMTHTLTSGMNWKNAKINLHGVFSEESTKNHLARYFKEFMQKSRVDLKPRLHLEPHVETYADFTAKYSRDADLLLYPLRPYEENPEAYAKELERILNLLPDEIPCVLLTCYDALQHREIYIESDSR